MRNLFYSIIFLLGTILLGVNAGMAEPTWECTLSILMSIISMILTFKFYRKFLNYWTSNVKEFEDI